MAKAFEPVEAVDMAALKEKGPISYDLLRPGNGTPWEDRGSRGALGAFFSTCVASIARPALLLDHISRLTTTADATAFAWMCAIPWALSAVIHNLILFFYWYPRHLAPREHVDDQIFFLKTAIVALIAVPAIFLLFRFGTGLYYTLITAELKSGSVPRSLVYNLCAYAMGPSLLAVIPLAGPPLALLLIFTDLIIAGRKRLFASWRGAIIDALLAFAACLAIIAAAYFVLSFLGDYVLGETIPEPVPLTNRAYKF
jgi:hypothetical protein